jgi:hypothetical protein
MSGRNDVDGVYALCIRIRLSLEQTIQMLPMQMDFDNRAR